MKKPAEAGLERNLIVEVIKPAGRWRAVLRCCFASALLGILIWLLGLILLRRPLLLWPLLRSLLGLIATLLALLLTTVPAIQHLHVACHDLSSVAILPILSLPFARLQPSFNVEARTLVNVLLSDLC